MATPKWFDADVYMQNKLVQMQASDPAYTMTDLVDAFAKAGYVGPEGYYAHFVQYGADEDVAPNAFFNAQEYYTAKAAQYYGEAFTGSELQVAEVKALIQAADMNAWTHYQQYGSAEGVDPSNAFDASAYCAAKALAMNDAGLKDAAGNDWTAESIAKAIDDAGMSVLEHYLTYAGTGEGEVAAGSTYPVADEDQVPNPGETVVVDGSATTYTGTAGDDTFYLKTGEVLQEYDTLDGGEGNDTLVLNDQAQAGTIKNIENLVVRDDGKDEAKTYDLSAFSSSFTLDGGTAAVKNVTSQKLIADGATNLTVNMAADQTSVDLTSQNRSADQTVVMSGDSLTSVKLAMDEGAQKVSFTGSDAKVTDLAVTATASAAEDDAAKVDVTGLEELTNITVAGAGAVELTVDVAKDALKTVNATDNTGGVTVDLSEPDKAAFTGGAGDDILRVNGSTVAHTLGAGDDTMEVDDAVFNKLAEGFSVDGGEGTDTLILASAVATDGGMTADVFNKTFTNFEELTISDKLTGNLDISGYTGIDHLTLSGADNAKTITMQSGSTLELTAGEGTGTYAGTLTVSVADAAAGKADVLNIALTGDTAVAGKTIAVDNVETINVVATDTDLTEVNEHSLTLKASAATTVTVSGDAKLELTLSNTDALKSINASENTGGLNVDVSTLSGVTVTGSSAADEITLGAQTVATGGEGKDTFTVTATEMTKYATITDFGAGDKIQLKGATLTDKFGEAISLESTATFEDYVTEAVKGTSAGTTNTVSWFQFTDGYTYVVLDASNEATFSDADMVVRLQGVSDLEGVQVTNGAFSLPEGA